MNRVVYMLWLQGWEDAPELVRACRESWVLMNPGWQVLALDAHSVREHVDVPSWAVEKLSAAQLSDLIRLRLLERHGGVWADATTMCNWPLDSWLPEFFDQGFFAFWRPARGYGLSSWFLAADAGHPLVVSTRKALEDYWQRARLQRPGPIRDVLGKVLVRVLALTERSTAWWFSRTVRDVLGVYPYFAFHYAFADVVRRVPRLASLWRAVPKISADGPHMLQRYGLDRAPDTLMRWELASPTAPVYKLTWKVDGDATARGTVLSELLEARPH